MAYEEKKERWNPITGQWETEHTRQFTRRTTTELFTMLMHPLHPLLMETKHVKDLHVLFALCEMAEFNTNKVFLVASRRQELMRLTKMTSQHLSNSLTRLRAAGIIYGMKGEAIINPRIAWKGNSANRAQAIKDSASMILSNVKSDFDKE